MSENKRSVHKKPPGQSSLSTFDEIVIDARNLSRTYSTGTGSEFHALRDVSISVPSGASMALVGPSGSGKSTLLNLIAGLDRPSQGHLKVAGVDLVALSEDELARHRGKCVGVVFQFFQLLPTLTALENVLLPMELVGVIAPSRRQERAFDLLSQFGVADQANKLPTTLSGGQQQRVAIARALANDPPLFVADEPTGNLDSRTAEQVIELILDLPRLGKSVILATHEIRFLREFDRVVALRDGQLDEQNDALNRASEREKGALAC